MKITTTKILLCVLMFSLGSVYTSMTRQGIITEERGYDFLHSVSLEANNITIDIFDEVKEYTEIQRSLSIAYQKVFPDYVNNEIGQDISSEYYKKSNLKIFMLDDSTLNQRLIFKLGMLMPCNGIYDPDRNVLYLIKSYKYNTIFHEYFHFLKDIANLDIEHFEEEEHADNFEKIMCNVIFDRDCPAGDNGR